MIVLHCLLRLIKTLLSSFRDHSPPFPASTWTRSLLLFRLFPSSLGQVPKQTSQNNKTRTICRTLATIQTDLVRFNTHTYLSYNCILEGGGGGGVLFPTRYICKKWQSSQQMGDMQPRLEWGISRHAHARKKVTVVSSGCGCNAGSQTYPIRRVLYVGGLCYRQVWSGHHQYKPLLHVETIIYHKESENNPLKSWPTRLLE